MQHCSYHWDVGYNITQIAELRDGVSGLKPTVRRQNTSEYEKTRDDVIVSFLPLASNTTQTAEQARYKAALGDNKGYLETVLYSDIWADLQPNERLAIEHLYFENHNLADRNRRLYHNLHVFVSARLGGYKTLARKYLANALWEILHNSPASSSNVLEYDKARFRRKAQATMLNSLGIPLYGLPTPDYIIESVRQHYASVPLEELLPNIAFPLRLSARTIAEEIQRINADVQQQLAGRKSIISDARTKPEATNAFVSLVEKIMNDVRGTISREISKQARQGKTGAEIVEHVNQAVEVYQDTVIPQKMEMLATHFNGKLTELEQREAGYTSYVWHSQDDPKVRPSHAANDGQIFAWDKPPPTGHPGEDYNCRCYAEPAFKDPPIEELYPELILIPAARGARIIKEGLKRVSKATGKIFKDPIKQRPEGVPRIQPSVRNPESLYNMKTKDVEKIADEELLAKGWKKEPLQDKNGIRYTDGKGGSFEINKGYPHKTDPENVHSGPYIKTTVGNKIVRIPIKGNPSIQSTKYMKKSYTNIAQKAIFIASLEEALIRDAVIDVSQDMNVDHKTAFAMIQSELDYIMAQDEIYLVYSKKLYDTATCRVLDKRELLNLKLEDVEFKEEGPFYYFSKAPEI